jgi:hypothetical protein
LRFQTTLQFAFVFFYNRVERVERVALELRNDVKCLLLWHYGMVLYAASPRGLGRNPRDKTIEFRLKG